MQPLVLKDLEGLHAPAAIVSIAIVSIAIVSRRAPCTWLLGSTAILTMAILTMARVRVWG